MSDERRQYHLYDRPVSYLEAQKFIDNYRRQIRQARQRYPHILPFIPTESYLLDYGCGWGVFSEWIQQARSCSVDGIDLDADSIAIARDLVGEREGLTFARRKIHEIESDRYDVVLSTQVAEHTHNPGNYVKECNRVLKPGGFLIISVPNILNLRQLLPMFGKQQRRFERISTEISFRYNKAHHHIQAWDPATFCRFLCSLGFEYTNHAFLEGVPLPGNQGCINSPVRG